jgi:phosphoribosylformylglycinamidine cyclo-ligase
MLNYYEEAGVSVKRGEDFVSTIASVVKSTNRPEVLSLLGGFNGAFRVPTGYKNPVMIASTDGVGSKVRMSKDYYNLGIDLAAMSINDVITSGAKPMFFLDYIACHAIDSDILTQVVRGVARACTLSDCTLLGGETAEMPSVYPPGELDLAGFCVGIVEEEDRITGENISVRDKIIGIPSKGPHANGFALISTLMKAGMEFPYLDLPTQVYTQHVKEFCKHTKVLGMAHITGGGLESNINRILPSGMEAHIDWNNSRLSPTWAETIIEKGNVPVEEVRSVFNMGVGYVFIVPASVECVDTIGTVVKTS